MTYAKHNVPIVASTKSFLISVRTVLVTCAAAAASDTPPNIDGRIMNTEVSNTLLD
jgi:hypothetical protein